MKRNAVQIDKRTVREGFCRRRPNKTGSEEIRMLCPEVQLNVPSVGRFFRKGPFEAKRPAKVAPWLKKSADNYPRPSPVQVES